MRRVQFGMVGSALSMLALGLFLAGCSKDKDKEEVEREPGKTGTEGPKAKPRGEVKFVEAKGSGTLKGKIALKGDPAPALAALTENFQKQVNGKPDEKPFCMAKDALPAELTQQVWRIGDNKQVGNVVVWLVPPDRDTYFKLDKKQVEDWIKEHPIVEIDQPHCAFLPHVATLFPSYRDAKGKEVPTGQKLIVVNNAKTGHNTNWSGGPKQPTGNPTLASGTKKEIEDVVADPSAPLTLKCNIHGWMLAYVWSFDHPYATVSKSDTAPKELRVEKDNASFGTYEIKGVPTGVPLKIVAWHEGRFLTNAKGDAITLKDGETTKDFELEVTP
jgi:hypothetical protein